MKTCVRFVAVLVLISPLTTLAAPSAFQIEYTGSVESLTNFGLPSIDNLNGALKVGDDVYGRIIVDADDLPNPSLSLFELTIGSYSASSVDGSATIHDNWSNSDGIVIAGSDFSSTPINGFSVDRLQFAVGTNNLSILDASSVVGPAEILALWYNNPNRYSGNLNFMSFGNGTGADETVRYALISVNASYIENSGSSIPDSGGTTVPAPGAFLLASMGAGLVGYMRRRKSL